MFFNRKKQFEEKDDPQEIRGEGSLHRKGTVYNQNSDPVSTLQRLIRQTQKNLLTVRSIYPLDFYPDTLTIDENKVNIIRKELFGMENIHSILIEDITNVTVGKGLFTATLEIVDSTNYRFPETYKIRHLNIKKALMARRLIQGLIAAKRQGIDLSGLDSRDIADQLENLGRARGEGEK